MYQALERIEQEMGWGKQSGVRHVIAHVKGGRRRQVQDNGLFNTEGNEMVGQCNFLYQGKRKAKHHTQFFFMRVK